MSDSPQDTKSRILDVAEELFSEQGLDRVSVRDIINAAKVNIASVSYHFGGKEELIAAIFERSISPGNQAGVAALVQFEAKVGGTSRMSFTNFTTGKEHSFGGTYLELVPNERLVYTDRFEDPNLPGEILVTIELKAVFCGTELQITQSGIPAMIPAEACYLGWQESHRIGRPRG